VAKGFLDSNGAVQATARVVADFPIYKPCSMGGNKKLKREVKKESKTPVKEDGGEAVVVVCRILGEVLEEVSAWGWPGSSEDDLSSSTEEEEASGGDSGESESAENISDGELEWLAKDLREVLAMPENKSARSDRGAAKVRGSRRVLKEGLGQVQQELEQRRRGRKRLKSGSSGRYQRPGYIPTQADAFLGVRRLLSFKALESYDEKDDKDYIPPEDEEILHSSEDEEKGVVQFASEVTMEAPISVGEIAKTFGKQLIEMKQGKEDQEMLARCLTETLTHCGEILGEGGEEFEVEKVVAGWKIIVESRKATEAKEELITVGEKRKDEDRKVTEDFVGAELDPGLLSPLNGEKSRVGVERELEEKERSGKITIGQNGALEAFIDVKNPPKEWETSLQTDSDEVVVENVAECAPLAAQREVSKPANKSKLVQGHKSPAKSALVTIFEEDESDLDVRTEIAEDNWEVDHKSKLEEALGVESDVPCLSRCVDDVVLRTVEESVESESPAEHMLRDQHGVSFKCLEDGEEVLKVEEGSSADNFSNHDYREDQHLEEIDEDDGLGEHGDNTGSHCHQAPSRRILSDEVLSGLRGLDGAILLLQKARLDLLRQVGLPAAASDDSAKEGVETIVGKCYQPGCLRRAAHKCRGCLQVQYCSKQCQELAWGEHHREECDQLAPLQSACSVRSDTESA